MGQAIGETIFEVAYLLFAVYTGIQLIRKGGDSRLPGLAALILGCGDAFHLVPRMYALWTDGTANHPVSLGFGTFVTSITMTVFYVFLYQYLKTVKATSILGASDGRLTNIYEDGQNSIAGAALDESGTQITKSGSGKTLDMWVYCLAGVRIALCLFPQNRWTSPDSPLSWGIIRNIPFLILGIVVIVYAYRHFRTGALKMLWLAVTLSFGFYMPVVLFSDSIPAIGAMMLPKTIMYIWILVMLIRQSKQH